MKVTAAIISHLRWKRTRSSCFKWSLGLKLSAFVHRGGAWYPAHVWKPTLGIHRSSSSLPQEQQPLLEAERSSPIIPLAVHRPLAGGSPHAALTRGCFCVQVCICHCHTSATLRGRWVTLAECGTGSTQGFTAQHPFPHCIPPKPLSDKLQHKHTL